MLNRRFFQIKYLNKIFLYLFSLVLFSHVQAIETTKELKLVPDPPTNHANHETPAQKHRNLKSCLGLTDDALRQCVHAAIIGGNRSPSHSKP